jgi:hypothetical protein
MSPARFDVHHGTRSESHVFGPDNRWQSLGANFWSLFREVKLYQLVDAINTFAICGVNPFVDGDKQTTFKAHLNSLSHERAYGVLLRCNAPLSFALTMKHEEEYGILRQVSSLLSLRARSDRSRTSLQLALPVSRLITYARGSIARRCLPLRNQTQETSRCTTSVS